MSIPRFPRPAALLLVGLLCAPFAHAQSDGAARAQADAYLEQAGIALRAGRLDAASGMIESALTLAPGYSEALYLRANVRRDDRAASRAVRDDLRRAVAAADWQRTDPDEPALALADLLVRTGALTEAEPLLRRLTRERPEQPRALLVLASLYSRRAALEKGTEARRSATVQEHAVLEDGIRRFPRHEEFPLRLSRSLAATGRTSLARAAVASALKELPDSLPLLLRSAELEPRADRRLKAVDSYLSKSGKDPLAPVLALEAKGKDAAGYLSLFISFGGLSRVDLAERAYRLAAASKAIVSSLRQELARYSGFRDLDRNGDGFWEERWELASGNLVSWQRDADQDGVPELAARFSDGQPVSLDREPVGGVSLRYLYSRYPSLHSVVETSAGGPARTSLLAPFTLTVPFLEKSGGASGAGMVPRAHAAVSLPAAAQLAGATWRTEDSRPGGGPSVRRVDSAKGLPTYMEEDLTGDGTVDHRVWYQNGSPVRGERDLADDGMFEARETWKDGMLWKSAVDSDGSGRVDYTEIHGKTVLRLWDYDEDGRDDSRQSTESDGTVVREFSTRLDGRFDLRVAFRGGRIVSVERAGKPLQVRAASGVVWIGRQGPSAALTPAAPDGFQRISGRRYLVFRYEGITYAEELE